MKPVLPVLQPWPLFDLAATRQLERAALASSEPQALMQRAGEAVARLALALSPHARRVWIAAGPGNNGGDGLEAAIHLHRAGKQVALGLFADPGALPVDARAALARAQAAGVEIGAPPPSTLAADDLAIDALLGIGASRAPEGALADAIHAFNALPCRRLAIDLPSGLNMRTGQPLGSACVVASDTLALLSLKPGLFTGAGRDHAGRVWLDALGIDVAHASPDAWLIGDGSPRAVRRHQQHKGSFGDVAVVGGAAGMRGAALLAGRAALAAGAGRVYLDLLDADGGSAGFDPARPELMFRAGWWQGETAALAAATVVCGCGGGDSVRAVLPRLLGRSRRLVLDADALNAIAADPMLQTLLRQRSARGQATVLTPHPLEAARLLGSATAVVQADRIAAATALAAVFACVVVLKGSGSVIAAPGRAPHLNSTGNASLASAGTGDVLAGWLGGLWAQHADADAFELASHAVATHGAASEPARPGPMRAGDLVEALYRQLRGA